MHGHERAEAARRRRDPPAAPHHFRFGIREPRGLPHIGDFRQDAARCGTQPPTKRPPPRSASCCARSATTKRRSRTGSARTGSRPKAARRSCTRSGWTQTSSVRRFASYCSPVRSRARRSAQRPELVRLGLAIEDGALLVPRARIVPTEGVYLAFDSFSDGDNDPPGWVASFTPTAYWLASLTLRRRVARAVDIGTGNGVHALLAARHADHVVATDINPARPEVHRDQRSAERIRQRRDAARQPLRTGRRRDVRSHHLQRAVRHLAAGALAVPRRRLPG